MIRVLSWFWHQPEGRTKFTAEHVNIWADMVRRNLSMPHVISCVTSTPEGIDASIEIIPSPGEFEDVQPKWGPRKPNCFRRLTMFRRDAAKTFGKRFVCMDLDCVIGGPLDPLFKRPEDLVLFKGTSPKRPYNGSMQLITAGCRPHVYESFDQAGADASGEAFHGSDQAWLAHCLGWGEATWDASDGVEWFDNSRWSNKRSNPRLLFFPGKIKPWTLAPLRIYPWITNNYRVESQKVAA